MTNPDVPLTFRIVPRENLLHYLTIFIVDLKLLGHNVILYMDANEDIYSTRMTQFMDNLILNDAVESLDGNKCPFTTTNSLTAKPIDN